MGFCMNTHTLAHAPPHPQHHGCTRVPARTHTSASRTSYRSRFSRNFFPFSLQVMSRVKEALVMFTLSSVQPRVLGVSHLCANLTFKKTESALWAHSTAGGMLGDRGGGGKWTRSKPR